MASFKHISKIAAVILCLTVLVAWVCSCSPKKGLKDVKDPFYEQWRVKAEESKGHSAVEPPAVDEAPFEIRGKEPADVRRLHEGRRPAAKEEAMHAPGRGDLFVESRYLASLVRQGLRVSSLQRR